MSGKLSKEEKDMLQKNKTKQVLFLYILLFILTVGIICLGIYVYFSQQKLAKYSKELETIDNSTAVNNSSPVISEMDTTELIVKDTVPITKKSDVPKQDNRITKNPQGHFSLDGKISKYKCHIDLDISGSIVSGTYYYTKQGPKNKLFLSGEAKNQNIELYELTKDNEQTGNFYGVFNGVNFTGTFLKYDGQSMKFSFIVR